MANHLGFAVRVFAPLLLVGACGSPPSDTASDAAPGDGSPGDGSPGIDAPMPMPSPGAVASRSPLELINILPVGTAGMGANNRIFRAYPGFEYNVRAAVIGGTYPYTFALTNAPPGMTIDSASGLIVWPNPQADASPTITVTDAGGSAPITQRWTVDVTTAGFRFVDATNGTHAQGNGCTASCGTGAVDNPWRSISDLVAGGAAAGEFVYFRAGTYVVTDMARSSVGTVWERVEINERTRPVVWLAYPGERPLIDFAYQAGTEVGPLIRFTGDNIWVDGFETTRTGIIGFQYVPGPVGRGGVFRRLYMHDLLLGGDGSNASFIMTTTNQDATEHMVIQDSEFANVGDGAVLIKIYAQHKLLVEGNAFHDAVVGVELKCCAPQFTVRRNRFWNISDVALGGNMHDNVSTTWGDIFLNHARGGVALDLNQDGLATAIQVSRNTLLGRVRLRNTDAADGPFTLDHNVIINDDPGSHVYFEAVTDPSRLILTDNLAGGTGDGIVDSNGDLTAAYASYRGTHGY